MSVSLLGCEGTISDEAWGFTLSNVSVAMLGSEGTISKEAQGFTVSNVSVAMFGCEGTISDEVWGFTVSNVSVVLRHESQHCAMRCGAECQHFLCDSQAGSTGVRNKQTVYHELRLRLNIVHVAVCR